MNYSKQALRQSALDVKKAHEDAAKVRDVQQQNTYARDKSKWLSTQKVTAVEALADALKNVKADRPIDTYRLRELITSPPAQPDATDCCTPTTQLIDTLVAVLDTIADDTVSSSALSQAGFKDLSRLLRRPC